jgi:CBS domain-containing protein
MRDHNRRSGNAPPGHCRAHAGGQSAHKKPAPAPLEQALRAFADGFPQVDPEDSPFPKGEAMRVSDAMTREVRVCHPRQSICDAAKLMAELDCGILPVGEDDRLVGMITDRDIAIRAVAQHKSPDLPVRDAMSREVKYCFEDQHVDQVARNMSDLRVRRLPVLDRDKRLVGILSLGDLASAEIRAATEAVSGVSRHGGPHSQSLRI